MASFPLTTADLHVLDVVLRDAHRRGELTDEAHDRVVITLAGARLHLSRLQEAATR